MNYFEKEHLGIFPTPLHRLPNLSRELGTNVWIKRDDLCGVALGGNKVRKLEYLLADAKKQGYDLVMTTGAAQSNHAMLTAACALRMGLDCILVLKKRGVTERKGNLILNHLMGVEVRFMDTDSYDDIYAEMDRIGEEMGRKVYKIPCGGSNALGSLGYVNCVKEISQQAEELGVQFSSIVSATGSGGTYAGLTYGAKLFLPGARSVGVGVCDDPFEDIAAELMEGLQKLMESDVAATREDIFMKFEIGPGYAIPSPEGCAAVRKLARSEGILVDPVYTGKALAGFFRLLDEGFFEGEENLLFVHTGGAGALFAVEMLPEE